MTNSETSSTGNSNSARAVRHDAQVIVVGFGPTGATLAALLAKAGIRVRVLEASPSLNPDPRASYFDGDALRVWQNLGIADNISARSIPLPGLQFRDADGDLVLDWPMPPNTGQSSWPASNLLHQPELEALLRASAAEHGAEIALGEKAIAVFESASGVVVRTDARNGTRDFTADYVVGCEGASSIIRQHIGGGWEDLDCTLHWHLADLVINGPTELPDVTTTIMDPSNPRMVGHLAANRYRWLWLQEPGSSPPLPSEREVFERLTHGVNRTNATLARVGSYIAPARVARTWSRGRLFIAGDAAHQLPPLLGQGIGSGVRDAANLAWKLAAVIDGLMSADILRTYEDERRPQSLATVALSANISRYVFTRDAALAADRNTRLRNFDIPTELLPTDVPLGPSALATGNAPVGFILPQWLTTNGMRTDDLLGDQYAYVIDPDASVADVLLGGLTHHVDVDHAAQPWLQANGLQAVVVRPDRVIAAVIPADLRADTRLPSPVN